MQILRQLVGRWPVWRVDVQLHAHVVVCLCCENRYRTTGWRTAQPHRQPLAGSEQSSALSCRSTRPSIRTKVGSSIHRVRPASCFLLVPNRQRRGAGVLLKTRTASRRVAPDWALTTDVDVSKSRGGLLVFQAKHPSGLIRPAACGRLSQRARRFCGRMRWCSEYSASARSGNSSASCQRRTHGSPPLGGHPSC